MIRKWSRKRIKEIWHDDYYRKLITLGIIVFLYMLAGSIVYGTLEGWSFVDSLYFSAMTISTIGYGDLIPSSAITKIFTILYAFVGIGIVFYVVGVIGKHYVDQEEERLKSLIERRLGLSKKPKS